MRGDDRLHPVGAREQIVPVDCRELDRVAIAGAAAVVVHRPAVHAVQRPGAFRRQRAEEARGPVAIAAVRARRDEADGDAELRDPRGVAAELGRVLFGREVAAAPPRLVADAPVADVERLPLSARRAQFGHRRRAGWCVAVFDPLIEILRRKTADVRGDVRSRADEPAETDEFVGAEAIGIEALRSRRRAAILRRSRIYPEVGAARPLLGRAYAVVPIVTVREASARPADDSRLDRLQAIDERFADAVDVCHSRLLADPDAVVHHTAKMLDEVPIDLRRNGTDRFVDQDVDPRLTRLRARGRHGPRQQQTGSAGKCRADEGTPIVMRHV